MKVSASNRPCWPSNFFITGILPSSLILYALVSNKFVTSSWKFNSSTYLSSTSQSWLFQYQSSIPLLLNFPLVLHCGWPGSPLCISECHHDYCSCLHGCVINYFFYAFRICHFSLYAMHLLHKSFLCAYVCLVEMFYSWHHVILLAFYVITKM